MPVVGLDDEIRQQQVTTEEEIERFEQSTSEESRRIRTKEEITLSKKKLESLEKLYDDVVVHDYGDDYHKTSEELEKENAFFQLYRKISGKKQKYRSLPEYIRATRDCLEFLYAVASRQHIYEKEDFITMWANDEIRITGMYLPKYKGKDRKRINGKALAEYILSDEDPENFIKEEEAPIIDSEEMLDQQIAQLFTVGEYNEIMRDVKEGLMEQPDGEFIDTKRPSTYEGLPIAIESSRKDIRKIMEKNPGLSLTIKESLRNSRRFDNFADQMVYDLHEEDYDAIRKYDEAYGVSSSSDIPSLHGSLMDGDDYQEIMDALDEWDWNNGRVEYHGKWMSKEELNESFLKELLDQNGFNIRALWNERSKEKCLKEFLKKERKREEKLRRELSRVKEENDKRDKQLKHMSDADIRKLTRKQRTRNKKNKKLKKKKKKQLDEILLGTVGSADASFKKYENEALDWSFGKMKKGGSNE